MIPRKRPILFVLGPSGAGKSTLGGVLAAAGFLHVEFDDAAPGAHAQAIHAALTPGFGALEASARIGPLARALEALDGHDQRAGTVVTFTSRTTLTPRQVAAVERGGIDIVVLYGTGAECLEGALARERSRGRAIPPSHWVDHNAASYVQMSLPHHAKHRVSSFHDGTFVGATALAARVIAHLARRNARWSGLAPQAHAGVKPSADGPGRTMAAHSFVTP